MVFNAGYPVCRRTPLNPPLKNQLPLRFIGYLSAVSSEPQLTQDGLNLTILLKQISITLSRAITITGRVLTSEYLICATSGGGKVEERFDRCGLPGRSNVKWMITMGLTMQESLDTSQPNLQANP